MKEDPNTPSPPDDPTGAKVLALCIESISFLNEDDRRRVLASLTTYLSPSRKTR